MHQRKSSSSLSVGALLDRGGDLEVVLGSGLGTAWTATSASAPWPIRIALHLEAGDVLAPAPQVVRLAVDEVEVAVLVDPADVAGVVPPVAARLDGHLGPAPVALEHHVGPLGPDHDLAVGSRGEFVVVVVEDPDVEVLVVDDAGGVGPVLDAGRLPRDQAGLGHAVRAAERLDAEARPQDDLSTSGGSGAAPIRRKVRLASGCARARHLGAVDVVGQQVGHGARASR